MRILKNDVLEAPSFKFIILLILCVVHVQSCKNDKKKNLDETPEIEKENVIEIITENMDFQMIDTIASGWNTFRYKNQSPQTHFFLIDKYPEGKTSKDAEKLVAPVFDSAMKLIMDGKTEEGFAEFSKLPEWFGEVVFVGGSGLLSPGQVGETTLNLKPGKYIVECYVKMSNGMFHTSMGMTKDLVVTENDSGNKPLEADITIEISSTDGIVFNDSISSGKHTFSVYYKDQIVHENFVGHDINLVKLEDNANLEELENWMNWADPKGLIEPAPKAITFMGGVNDMPTGSTGYFTATFNPGRYVLISEVPDASQKNMLKTFEVR
ncbi:hypothetical protein [Winogradskyella aquimaris]|uniref:DUF4382 domain-containing protein n=1 Tax=Winogradskyella aquimaris TaxID=864074 RepID=A0ABU5EPY2_9FLAO|nr:hypothetical protein [Winogradskyella aquimaris]MDY2588184.1 hypothetical protein [Winogradskyella aquimaris]